ncbi:DUF916 and DUF3324 domain-containing protein [Levilactobacillus fujinensis]|uniref:DUF916 and DUF3324 domain-containing protein n=1 Tax=Levilactobacillus fujinensis TaxID=2486024 RepID=A0ABW1THE0_9LACO|nr:DUF916 and DUF3324 domain-containing protein [Levilactobacillus fujinensis]
MKRYLRILMLLGAIFVFGSWGQAVAHADGVGFSVAAQLPKNQDDKSVTYFALRVKPNQKQKLGIIIANSGKKKATFQYGVNQSITNDNGVIDYSNHNPKKDSSLKIGISDIFIGSRSQKVTIPAKSKKVVYVTYKMPADKIKGMILGGVFVKKMGSTKGNSSKGVNIKNQFAYVIGVRLRESSAYVGPNMKLNTVKAGQINAYNQVQANLQNPEPGIMSNLKIKAKVTKQGESKTVLSNEKANMAMAPNSNFNYSIPWGDTKLAAGDYTLTLDASAKGGYTWHFVKNFSITQAQINSLKNKINTPQQKNYFWWFVAGGILILLLIAIIIYLLWKRRRDDDEYYDDDDSDEK